MKSKENVKTNMLEKILEWFPEEQLLKADGFDDAIIVLPSIRS